jgi:hypothetical protein
MPKALIRELFASAIVDAEHLADERPERRHRAPELAAEDADELVRLLVRRVLLDEHADAPVPFGHHLRSVGDRGHLEPPTSVPSTSPSVMSKTSVTRQKS